MVKAGDFIGDAILKPGFSSSWADQYTTNTINAPSKHYWDYFSNDSAALRYVKRAVSLRLLLNQGSACLNSCSAN
jgi:hypothetical protein